METGEKEIEKRKSKIKDRIAEWWKDPYNKVFLIILIAAFVIRFIIFLNTTQQPLWFDEANFLSTAKKWAGLDVNNIWYYRRGFLWVLIPTISFVSGFGETGVRFLEVLLSTGLVAVSYSLVKLMFDKKMALFTSAAVAASWVYLFFTARPMTEIPATFFILLALLFFWKGYELKQGNKFIYIFAVFYALAIMTRTQYLMFAFPLLIFVFTKEKFNFIKNKHLWLAILIFLVMFTPYFILYWQHYGNPVTDILAYYFGITTFSSSAQTEVATRTFSTIFDYFKDMPYLLTKTIFVFFIIGALLFFADLVFGFDKIFQNENIRKKLFILLWIVIPFLVLGYITEYVEQRYDMPALPFIYLIAILPFIKIEPIIEKNLKLGKKVTAVLIFLILIALFIPNYTWGKQLIQAKITSYIEVKESGLWIKENSQIGDIVISNSQPQTMYYSERPTYSFNLHDEGTHYKNPDLIKYPQGEQGFIQFIKEKKPKYMILSAFEKHEQWMYDFPQKNNATVIPVQVYSQQQQPVLVIYQFKYS